MPLRVALATDSAPIPGEAAEKTKAGGGNRSREGLRSTRGLLAQSWSGFRENLGMGLRPAPGLPLLAINPGIARR